MFRVNTFVNFLLSFIVSRENKQTGEEIHWFPSLKLSKLEIVWKQYTTFLNRARDDSKRYTVTKAFFALKGRTDITWNIIVWYRTHESELENALYHANNDKTHASYMLCSTTRKSTKRSCVIVYEIYRLPDIQIKLMLLSNLRMRLQQIAFVLKRIVPLGLQENIWAIYSFVMLLKK